MKATKWIFQSNYLIFYWGWNFEITYELCGYFDNRPRININLIFFRLCLILPFRNEWENECSPPKWGIAIHNNTFWIYKGGKGNMNGGNKWLTAYMPWSLQWVRTSYMKKDGTWEHEIKGSPKDTWNDILFSESHPYTYKLKSGTVQNVTATIKVVEREWRWHWFRWLPITKKINRSIDIGFDGEVGERAGSWKGGTTGCSYELLANELPVDCLRRMEQERKF